jgi:hypothetical protein
MKPAIRLAAVVALVLASGCVEGSVVLHVSPEGRGRAVITSRIYPAGLQAFDRLFPFGGTTPRQISAEEELPAPDENQLSAQLGARVRLASTRFDKTSDGGIRTTIVEFDDVRQLKMRFPPKVLFGSSGWGGFANVADEPLIQFAMKPHENGDRLLLVKLPDNRVEVDPMEDPTRPEMTVFADGSPEEQAFKQAIKKMALRFFVELEDTALLRSNSPAIKGNRVTILDLDLERIINQLDEQKVRRAMNSGSIQDILWQLGDMPGAVVPVEHEVFLEFEGPQQPPQPPPAAQPAAQAPPDTEIYLAPLKGANGTLEVGAPVNITSNPGYDNQPFFTRDGAAVLFTSTRTAAGAPPQTDIYRYDIADRRISQVTRTPESEYSPTVTPSGALSVIRVELDGNNTQRLWQFTLAGADPKVVLENVKPVGYHAWADDHTLALFVLGQPATLQLADRRSGTARTIATDIGRSIQVIPGTGAVREISFVQRERDGDNTRLVIKKLNPASGDISVLTPAVPGRNEADTAWTPDGTLLMASATALYAWRPDRQGWKEIATLERLSLSGVTRLAVSPRGDYLALVATPRPPR